MGIYEPYIRVEEREKPTVFTPRDEQREAIDKAFKFFKKNDGKCVEFLWNAKMRFGKTISTLWLIEKLFKELNKKKVLIVTHRPVVNKSWHDDFVALFKDSRDKYSYISKETDGETSLSEGFSTFRRDVSRGKCSLFFVSMQYLRLSKLVGGKDESHIKKEILKYDWDLVVIDEAHEGTQTDLGEGVINYLKKENTKILHLSGTPFNLLDKFGAEQIYNWDYIKEQQTKRKWDEQHPLMPEENPYRELPQMEILTFKMGEMTDENAGKIDDGKDFSFTEFFRVKQGVDIPKEERGKFIHEAEVLQFLKKLCATSPDSHYPFSNDEYRNCFRHTLWVVPGVKEAQALKKLIEEKTPLCSRMGFKVVNVAGNSDEDEQKHNALEKVLNAIGEDSDRTRTITLSCGRLTTGVTVKPWTAVLYLKGSDTTSASTYMQTIFRVQSPHIINGTMKSKCYVFDFAPERALTMMAETAKYSRAFERKEAKGEKKQKAVIDQEDKDKMKQLLNECPIIETDNGSPVIVNGKMQPIDCERLFSQLNSVYVDKVVRSGFEHSSLYNYNEFLRLDLEDEFNLNYIDSMFGDERRNQGNSETRVVVNEQEDNLTDEQKVALERERKEREEAAKKAKEEAKKKYADMLAQMTEEEREKFLEEKAENARKKKLINQCKDKLHGLSIRIPLMMYGANVQDVDEVTIDTFTDERFIDEDSWNEFMPKGISRELFGKLSKFYNADVFRDAGIRIRQLAKEADSMKVEERIARIAQIFKWFKNPDRETVLTPWEVVNRHMSSTLGGYCFFEDDFTTPARKKDEETGETLDIIEPRFIDQGKVTKEIFGDGELGNIDELQGKINTKVLEINSKTGLYPLYVAYSLYRHLLPVYAREKGLLAENPEEYSAKDEQAIWDEVVNNNLYVICNTKMAERITRRTLMGFRSNDDKLHIKQDKLITRATTDRDKLISDLLNENYWENNKMKKSKIFFNAVVGNPPYQETTAIKESLNGQKPSRSIFHYFQLIADSISNYTSLIYPGGRWIHRSGKSAGLKEFGLAQINDDHLQKVIFYPDWTELFEKTQIADGITIVMKDTNKNVFGFDYIYKRGDVKKSIRIEDKPNEDLIPLDPTNNIIISFIKRGAQNKQFSYLTDSILPRSLFGIESSFVEENPDKVREYVAGDYFDTSKEIKLFTNDKAGKAGRAKWYVTDRVNIPSGHEYINRWKVIVSSANAGGQKRNNQIEVVDNYSAFGRSRVALKDFGTQEEAQNFFKYATCNFIRFAFLLTDESLTSLAKWVPDISNYHNDNGIIDFSKDIDKQLFELFEIPHEHQDYINFVISQKDL